MLKTRVITALVLMALFLPALLWSSPMQWALLMAGFVGIGAWEWGSLMRFSSGVRIVLGGTFAGVAGGIAWFVPEQLHVFSSGEAVAAWVPMVLGISVAFWSLLVPFWLRHRWPIPLGLPGILVGFVVLLPTWLAMVQLRGLGPGVLFFILGIVWIADIAAYFSGRAFGKHKLAPAISPGKTWEGAVGAVVGVVIYGFILRFAGEFAPVSSLVWVCALLIMTAVSIIGDLYESMLKRQAGIKDSSNVLPGHGGVLDRIDSLTSTLPLVTLLWLLAENRI